METITKLEYWRLERAITENKTLSLCGSLWYSADIRGASYKDNNNKKWLTRDKDGFKADEELIKKYLVRL